MSDATQTADRWDECIMRIVRLGSAEDRLLASLTYLKGASSACATARALSQVLEEYQSELAGLVGEIGIRQPAEGIGGGTQ